MGRTEAKPQWEVARRAWGLDSGTRDASIRRWYLTVGQEPLGEQRLASTPGCDVRCTVEWRPQGNCHHPLIPHWSESQRELKFVK